MTLARHPIVIVTPVYEDTEACGRLFKELCQLFGQDVFIVAVDDGSVKQPVEARILESAGVSGAILTLRRNVGHQRAIAIGLGYTAEHMSHEQTIVVMDSDGEDVPKTIPELIAGLQTEQVDVVVAQRKSRLESLQFKSFYLFYRLLFSLMTGREISFGNFMALKTKAVKRLVAMQELPIHVAAAVLASKLRTQTQPIDRGPRYAGISKMNFVGLTLHGFKALMVFAEDVLVRVGIACTLIASLSIIGVGLAVGLKLIGFSTPGWFSVALGILVLMLLQTGALALMSLMLTGVMRGGTVAPTIAYNEFVESICEVEQKLNSA